MKQISAISLLTPRSAAPATAVEEPVLLTNVVNASRKTTTAVCSQYDAVSGLERRLAKHQISFTYIIQLAKSRPVPWMQRAVVSPCDLS